MATRKSEAQKEQDAAVKASEEQVDEAREAALADSGPNPPSGGDEEVGPEIFEVRDQPRR